MAAPAVWRVGLIDSYGGVEVIGPGVGPSCRVIDSAAFALRDGRVERAAPLADPTGHGSRIARILVRDGPLEWLFGQVFTAAGPASSAAVAAAIDWAADHGAALIHLSLGLAVDRAVLGAAVRRAAALDRLIVAAMPARGAPVYPAAYPGVIRATGDARCAPGEISALGPWLFGGCPRLKAEDPGSEGVGDRTDGRSAGGASIGAAWVTRALLKEPLLTAAVAAEALTVRAKYHGPERRARGGPTLD
jgi:hypothetical protein